MAELAPVVQTVSRICEVELCGVDVGVGNGGVAGQAAFGSAGSEAKQNSSSVFLSSVECGRRATLRASRSRSNRASANATRGGWRRCASSAVGRPRRARVAGRRRWPGSGPPARPWRATARPGGRADGRSPFCAQRADPGERAEQKIDQQNVHLSDCLKFRGRLLPTSLLTDFSGGGAADHIGSEGGSSASGK